MADARSQAGPACRGAGHRLQVGAGLQLEQLRIQAFGGHQVVVAATLDDASRFHDVDAVGAAHAGEAVGDEQGRPPVQQLADVGEQGMFGAGVERRGGLVEDDQGSVPTKRPG